MSGGVERVDDAYRGPSFDGAMREIPGARASGFAGTPIPQHKEARPVGKGARNRFLDQPGVELAKRMRVRLLVLLMQIELAYGTLPGGGVKAPLPIGSRHGNRSLDELLDGQQIGRFEASWSSTSLPTRA